MCLPDNQTTSEALLPSYISDIRIMSSYCVQQICIFMKVPIQQSHIKDSYMQRWGSRPDYNYFAVKRSFSTLHKTISVAVHILK